MDKVRSWIRWIRGNKGLCFWALVVLLVYVAGVVYIWTTFLAEHYRMERLGWWSQSIAAVAAIVAAFFVAAQVADLKRSTRTSAFEATAARMQDIARVLLAHPKLHKLLKQGKLTAESELLAETLLDNMDTELLRQEKLPDPWKDEVEALKAWYKDLFREMPGLRQTLDKRDTWYRRELHQLRESAMRDK